MYKTQFNLIKAIGNEEGVWEDLSQHATMINAVRAASMHLRETLLALGGDHRHDNGLIDYFRIVDNWNTPMIYHDWEHGVMMAKYLGDPPI